MTLPVTMTVALHRSALDARRGVVRVHPQVLSMLGIRPWDPLVVEGARLTGALAAEAGPLVPRSTILMDELICANADTMPGEQVRISPGEISAATEAVIAGSSGQNEPLDPFALRFALLGKIVTPGDRVSLLPQDFVRPEGAGPDIQTLMHYLTVSYGEQWQKAIFEVQSARPSGLVQITMETIVMWAGEQGAAAQGTATSATPISVPTREDLPGHERPFDRLAELLDLSLNHPELLAKLGTKPRVGVLITGPPGSGKVAVVEGVAAKVGARLVRVWGPEIVQGDVSMRLEEAVAQASASPPAVILIEDVDSLAPRDEASPHLGSLLESIRKATGLERVAVVCTTAHPEATSADLRRPDVLDHELQLSVPSRRERRSILDVLTRQVPLDPAVSLDDVAARTPGFVAADLMALCREASLRAAQRSLSDSGQQTTPIVGTADFEAALEVVHPSSMQGAALDIADIKLDDVGDMEEVKRALDEAIVWPIKYPDTFQRMGVEAPRGVLLYGPPGCGKTFLVKALANEAEANFLAIKGAELLSKWVGESERGVRELFDRARSAAPAIVFFDEVDALAPTRGAGSDSGVTDRIVASLLTELDGLEEARGVSVVAATNRPDLIDPALLRPGRIERHVFVPPPDAEARIAILKAAAHGVPIAEGVALDAIATACEGYSSADLAAVVRAAAMIAMRENMQAPAVTSVHFDAALASIKPSLDKESVERLAAFGS